MSSATLAGRAPFIVFDGPEAAGKSEQIERVARRLDAAGRPFVRTREPGGTAIGEEIRERLLRPGLEIPALTELLLFAAQRSAHVEVLIRPALARGELVLCDRYALSTRIYQGVARGLGTDLVDRVNRIATGGLEPDLYVILDVPPEVGRTRQAAAGARRDRIEEEDLAFMERVRAGYRAYASDRERACLIDGAADVETVASAVSRELATRFPDWFE